MLCSHPSSTPLPLPVAVAAVPPAVAAPPVVARARARATLLRVLHEYMPAVLAVVPVLVAMEPTARHSVALVVKNACGSVRRKKSI